MKKFLCFIILLGVIFGGFLKYSLYVKGIENSIQGKPERAVEEFLKISEKWSGIFWNEEEREKIKSLMDKMEKDELSSLGLKNPSYLFKDSNYGMSALSTFVLYEFGVYKIGEPRIEKNKAEVYVDFYAKDFMGLKSLLEDLTGKKQKGETKEEIPFQLERKRYKWYIVSIGGDIGKFIDKVYSLRKYK
ncbi:MAG: hypothetical protein DRP67_04030 [Candidatus Omnitrophota bacterium]|nr:MAG: hypothetical protein DRP67_04030 [Candidatus Omnitrophota bacterium]